MIFNPKEDAVISQAATGWALANSGKYKAMKTCGAEARDKASMVAHARFSPSLMLLLLLSSGELPSISV